MSTASLKRHYFGLNLSVRVIAILQNHGWTRHSLVDATVTQLTAIGLEEAEAQNAIRFAKLAKEQRP